jgi:hypothetical protein
MRYRKLDANGDMQFGHGAGDFWHDQPEGVGQSVQTRLLLFAGEWYLDTRAGTPWGGFPLNDLVVRQGKILAEHTQLSRDAAIRDRILTTVGVVAITDYGSYMDSDSRAYSVTASIDTVYGQNIQLIVNAHGAEVNPTATIHYAIKPQPRLPGFGPKPPILARLPMRG